MIFGVLLLTMVPITKSPIFAVSPAGLQRMLLTTASEPTLPSIDDLQSPLADLLTPYRYQSARDSGTCKSTNCGPAAVAMAIGWAQSGQWIPISDIRGYISGTGTDSPLLSVSDLTNALGQWGVGYSTITGMDAVKDAISIRGHIVIVPVVMSAIPARSDYLTPNSDAASYYDRFYSYTSGHFVVAKGVSSDGNWVIVRDPDVWDGNGVYWYSNLAAKGLSRYYSYSNLATALDGMGNQAIEILGVATKPAAPSNLRVTGVTQTSITFAWNDNSDNETGFNVYRWSDVVWWVKVGSVGANVTSYTDSSLTCGNTYIYMVDAYNGSGKSSPSVDVGGTTSACVQMPAAPSNLRVTGVTQTS
ncbi:MAG: fibronectin type III domain-containing protein, partial [Chloroflexota bacterium]|nr:fibronectin type III domain-containing protein [Chloroflexota bacterium]